MIFRLFLFFCLSSLLIGCQSFRDLTPDGVVEEDYGVRTRGVKIEDKDIEQKVLIGLQNHKNMPRDIHAQVNAYNRIVLLTGQVPNQASKQKATDIAQATRHVRSVHNELEIAPAITFGQKSKDRMLATRIRARLLAADGVQSKRVEMVVENGNVYFMGLVTKAESQRIIEAAQLASGIKKIVKVFEYID
jgi:osmotically-inducible protein OsmY